MPQARTSAFDHKSDRFGKMLRLLENDDGFSSTCQNGYEQTCSRSPSIYFDTVESPKSSSGPVTQEGCPSSRSSLLDQPRTLHSLQNIVVGSSDESGSEFETATGRKLVSDSNGLLGTNGWKNLSETSVNDELDGSRDDLLIPKFGGSSRHRRLNKHTLSWRERYTVQPPRSQASIAKNLVDGHPQRVPAAYQTQRAYRKGSSSKAPQTSDLTAPLLLEKGSRSITNRDLQGESEDHELISMGTLVSNVRNASARQTSYSTNRGIDGSSRRKGNSYASHSRHCKSEDTGAGRRDMDSNGAGLSRRGLSNLVCASAADVLQSLSSSTLSNLACSSSVDVLPSVPTSATESNYLHSRRRPRTVGLEGETSRRPQPLKRQVEEAEGLSRKEFQNGADQTQYVSAQGPQLGRVLHSYTSQPEPLGTDFVSCETSLPSCAASSSVLLLNNRQRRRNGVLSRSRDGLRSSNRPGSPFSEAHSTFGEEFSREWSSRRRSLYGSVPDPMCRESRSSNRPSSNTWSILREMHYPQPTFHRPPARPPPLPPVANFAEASSSENGLDSSPIASNAHYSFCSQASDFALSSPNSDQPSAVSSMENNPLNHANRNGEGRPRLTVEGLSEILSALEYIERDDLSYEQILMLEATLLLGGIGLHDRYRDMRIDIDNMSYEELLALEERIGNVNTGLSEDSVRKTVRVEIFTSPEVTHDYVPQEIEIKCSICQEEFEEAVELGVLNCGHSHHIACIKQWLLQKNQCPICKAPAML